MLMLTVLSSMDLNAMLHNVYVAIIGGVATAVFGVVTFRSKAKSAAEGETRLKFSTVHATHRWQLTLSGFLLNFLNPLIWLYWISIITFLSAEMELSNNERYLFFVGLLIAVFGTDVLKCRLASMLQQMVTARILNIFNKITGIILMAFSVYLIVSMVRYQTLGKDDIKQIQNNTNLVKKIHNMVNRDSSSTSQADTLQCDSLLLADSTMVEDSIN
jgi:threonine/homoserine/homoserine lactone efflux protein